MQIRKKNNRVEILYRSLLTMLAEIASVARRAEALACDGVARSSVDAVALHLTVWSVESLRTLCVTKQHSFGWHKICIYTSISTT